MPGPTRTAPGGRAGPLAGLLGLACYAAGSLIANLPQPGTPDGTVIACLATGRTSVLAGILIREPREERTCMSVISGFAIAILAGLLVPDARRAAITAAVPWLVVVAAQTWGLALGYGTSPPSTVTRMPDLISYWAVQTVFFGIAVGIAAELGSLRAGHAALGRRYPLVMWILTSAAFVFTAGYLLTASPHHHVEEGTPPVWGLVGMALSVLALIVFSALLVRRGLRGRRAAAIV